MSRTLEILTILSELSEADALIILVIMAFLCPSKFHSIIEEIANKRKD